MTMLRESAQMYARKWFLKERELVRGIESADQDRRVETLAKAAGYFKVARNLPRRYDVDRGRPRMLPALEMLTDPDYQALDRQSAREAVRDLRARLAIAYGGRDLLSAASKFLWLTNRASVVIYDSQAQMSLKTSAGDYDSYLDRWMERYSATEATIKNVCREMADAPITGSELLHISSDEFRAAVTEDWFAMRVFDMQLWQPVREESAQ